LTMRLLALGLLSCLISSCVSAAAPDYDQSPFGVNYLKWHYFDCPGGIDDLRLRMRIMKDIGHDLVR